MSKYMRNKSVRNYRERQRKLKYAINGPKKPAMTCCERMRLYRQRKKLALQQKLLEQSVPEVDSKILSEPKILLTEGNSLSMDNPTGDYEYSDHYDVKPPLFMMNTSTIDDQVVIKEEPVTPTEHPPAFDESFIGSALLDSLRNVPDPILGNAPRGKKNPVVTLDSIKKELTFECELCSKRFRKSADLFQHKLTHGEQLDCDKCAERFFKLWELTKHKMEKHTDKPLHKCNICSKTFIENWRLLRHMRTHSDDKKFKCEMCDKSFSESGNLVKHKKQTHKKDRPFECDQCDKTYPQKKDLQGHMLVHSTKRFICTVCKEEFALLEEKRAHVRLLHPQAPVEKIYTCTLCDATLNSKATFLSHSLTHGERRFECKFCMKKFHTHARMRKHVRAHQVEHHSRCEICDKTFSQECNMKRHIELMHMQGDRYYCLHCPLTFLTSDELKAHRILDHQDELPYKCAFCEKSFSHHQSLANHTKCHRNPKRHLKEFVKPTTRKRRIPNSNGESSEQPNEDPLVPIQVKKRGRPKITKLLETESIADYSLSIEITQTNGAELLQQRSNGTSKTEVANINSSIPVQVKKRGRPKKKIPTATVTKETDSLTESLDDTPSVEQLKDNNQHEKTHDEILVPIRGKKSNETDPTIVTFTTTESRHHATSNVEISHDCATELTSEIKIEDTDFIDIGPTEIQEVLFDS